MGKPSLTPTVAALLTIAVFCRLGGWQLSRAEQKEAYVEAFVAGLQATPRQIEQYRAGMGRAHVVISGHYDNRHTLLLDNQIHQGQPGVHVFVPFVPQSGGETILVNRGWLPMTSDRQVPVIPSRDGMLSISGVFSNPPQPGIRLGAVDLNTPDWPVLVPYFDLPALSGVLKSNLAPQILLSTDQDDSGLLRDWKPGGMSPDRHLAYALQWFSLALAVLVVYLVVNFKRNKRVPRQHE
jgi:surfeit locus 1 family protein